MTTGRTLVGGAPAAHAPKRILFLTGTRADFGKMKPLIHAVQDRPEFESSVFVTGMHMLSRYGFTVKEVEKAGCRNLFTFINQIDSGSNQMDLVLANTTQGFGTYVREFPPDLIVVHGDRVEALAGAIVGALNNILVAHIEGGERSGTVDGLIRHAVSKLAHLHFVANAEARKRLVQMGELAESICVVGSPDIDVMLSDSLPSLPEVQRRYEIPFSDYAIFVYHPVTTELPQLRQRIGTIVEALERSERNFLVIYPNNDSGSETILEAILPLERSPRFRVLRSMRFEHFLSALKHARAIVGNSSAGIREAPVYGVPTINIGTRQMDRYHYPSILNVREDVGEILHALANLPTSIPPSEHFGRGDSARLFLEALQRQELWATPRQKQFKDIAFEEEILVG